MNIDLTLKEDWNQRMLKIVKIRKAKESDFAQILDLQRNYHYKNLGKQSNGFVSFELSLDSLREIDKKNPIFVAETRSNIGEVIGYTFSFDFQTLQSLPIDEIGLVQEAMKHFDSDRYLEGSKLFEQDGVVGGQIVLDPLKGTGVSTLLLRASMNQLRKKYSYMVVGVSDQNSASKGFVSKNEFLKTQNFDEWGLYIKSLKKASRMNNTDNKIPDWEKGIKKTNINTFVSGKNRFYIGPYFPKSFFNKDSKKSVYNDSYIRMMLRTIAEKTKNGECVEIVVVSEVAHLLQKKYSGKSLSVEKQIQRIEYILKTEFASEVHLKVKIKTLQDYSGYKEVMDVLRGNSPDYSNFIEEQTGEFEEISQSSLKILQSLIQLYNTDSKLKQKIQSTYPGFIESLDVNDISEINAEILVTKPYLLYPFINISFKIYDLLHGVNQHAASHREGAVDSVIDYVSKNTFFKDKLSEEKIEFLYLDKDQNPYNKMKLQEKRDKRLMLGMIAGVTSVFGGIVGYESTLKYFEKQSQENYQNYIHSIYDSHPEKFRCYADFYLEVSSFETFSETVDTYYRLLETEFFPEDPPDTEQKVLIKKLIADAVFDESYYVNSSDICSFSLVLSKKYIFLFTFIEKNKIFLSNIGVNFIQSPWYLNDTHVKQVMGKLKSQKSSDWYFKNASNLKKLYRYTDSDGLKYGVYTDSLEETIYAGYFEEKYVAIDDMGGDWIDTSHTSSKQGDEQIERYFMMQGARENAFLRMNEELKTFLFQNRFLFEYNSDPFYCSWNEYQESDEYYGEFQMGGEIYEVGYIYEDFDLEKKFLVTKKRGTKCFVPGKEFLDRAVHNEWPWL